MSRARLAIVGAGIVGLAHALAGVRRGYAVTVYERDSRAVGASVRNFGLGLSLGQTPGEMYTLAQRSRSIWLEVLAAAGCWHKAQGSLMVARNEAELDVLEAFQQILGAQYGTRMLAAPELAEYPVAGKGALFSASEIALDARSAIPALAAWLAEVHQVQFCYETQVNAIELPRVHTSRGVFEADRVIVCSGHDFQTLYPASFAPLGIRRCALQMMRVANPGITLGPTLMTGLSTLHYPAFTECAAMAAPLSRLREQVRHQELAFIEHGIHLIVQQVAKEGELILGDSHCYDETISPFNQTVIDATLLELAQTLLQRPLHVMERWQGVYASGPRPYEVLQPCEGVTAVAITAGVGMSIAFALAERHLYS